jgi:hypothetical protein
MCATPKRYFFWGSIFFFFGSEEKGKDILLVGNVGLIRWTLRSPEWEDQKVMIPHGLKILVIQEKFVSNSNSYILGSGMVHAYVGQKVTVLTTDGRPRCTIFLQTTSSKRCDKSKNTTTNRHKHRDHGGGAALLSSDVELMNQRDRTCGRPVHGIGWGRG